MIGFEHHDHHTCIATCVAEAERKCQEEGLRLTDVRRRVLEILLERHKAVGAYDILDVLKSEGLGSQPPVAYRALDFLVANGFAHKIERLNAFVACGHPNSDCAPAFLICRGCEKVAETQAIPNDGALGASASAAGFVIERAVVEAVGLCPDCQTGAAA
jgi:Fur family zinc uptake transcriptional regulator